MSATQRSCETCAHNLLSAGDLPCRECHVLTYVAAPTRWTPDAAEGAPVKVYAGMSFGPLEDVPAAVDAPAAAQEPAGAPIAARKHPHYFKDVSTLQTVDVYRVLSLFSVTDPCLQHAVKKLLVAGGRGAGKDIARDVKEAMDTLARWVEMRAEDEGRSA
jgi:hypothetical protein